MTEQKPRLMEIDGHKLVMQPLTVTGSGTPVVLIHGVVVSLNFFIPPLVPLFAGDRDAFALSLPGHYPAAFPPEISDDQLTAESYTDWMVEAVRQSFGGAPVILAGHSTGGFAALAIAARAPNLVRDVISVAGFARGEWLGTSRQMQDIAGGNSLQKFLFRAFYNFIRLSPGTVRSIWRTMAVDPGRFDAYAHNKELAKAIHTNMRQLDLAALALTFRRMLDIDITDWLPDITAPTLVIAGTKDSVVDPDQSRQIAEHIPDATLHMMEGLGHLLYIEDTAGFQVIVSDWYAAHNL